MKVIKPLTAVRLVVPCNVPLPESRVAVWVVPTNEELMIELIHQADGLAVMAHPGLNRADEIIPALVRAGLDGLECFHTKHTPAVGEHYVRLAKEFGLLITGGSDCHGLSKGKPLIGTIKLPYEYVEHLKAANARRHSNAPAPRSELRPAS